MADKIYLSTTEYAKKNNISKMQVIRLIQSGKIIAQRVGFSWMIESTKELMNQIGFEKTTSLQKWNKQINSIFHKNLSIENEKDRELIYSRLHNLGLPHERCLCFPVGKFPTKNDFEAVIENLGTPYWISAVPDLKFGHLYRQSKLRIYNIKSGWKFINNLQNKKEYKIIVMQYADNPDFKGTALISKAGNGMVEFITGDRHYIMTRGFTLTDPMLFDCDKIIRYSKTITEDKQNRLFELLRKVYGHLEFQYGTIDKKKQISFFDFNEEKTYMEIDKIWNDLVKYFTCKKKQQKKFLYGLPASSGYVIGRCVVVHHETFTMYNSIKKGDILVSDSTTPEMTLIMKKVAAIVTDFGGVTSHAAIVCRELNIPAVVGVGNATEILKTGDLIRVDADKGEIKILPSTTT